MAKKDRPDPITEGSIRRIYELFFGKLVFYKPLTMSLRDWMEHLFDIKNRDITRYKVNRAFTMPGLLCVTSNQKVQGIGFRAVKPGAELYVRRDALQPNVVEVEWVGKTEQLFSLSASEWNWVELHVREQERARNRTVPRPKGNEYDQD